jgi:tetratricopeptide (TPR) repeat protein
VAGNELSRQAVHLVEKGKARPSSRTIELIAQRTGKPLSYFLQSPEHAVPDSVAAAIKELQWLCLDRGFDRAKELGTQILKDAKSARSESEIRYYLGQALVQLSSPVEALPHLQLARKLAESESDSWLAVECLDWEAGALYAMEDSRALSVAEEALRRCQMLEPRLPRTEARILEHLGAIHVRNHTIDSAISSYEAALEAAGSVRDLARLARTYHGLSIAYQERGLLERAEEFVHKALSLYTLEHDEVLIARAENELGVLLMRRGQLQRAEALFVSALDHFEKAGVERTRSHVLLSLGELHLKRGESEMAADFIKRGFDLASRLDEHLALAAARQLRGQFLAGAGKTRSADREFESAIQLLGDLGLRERLAEAHAAYAALLQDRGHYKRATDHWRRAAVLALPKLQPEPATAV